MVFHTGLDLAPLFVMPVIAFVKELKRKMHLSLHFPWQTDVES